MDGQIELTVNPVEEVGEQSEEDKIRMKIYWELNAELDKHKLSPEAFRLGLRLMYLVAYPGPQTPQIQAEEADTLKAMHNTGCSYGDLAFIFHRSKSSIWSLLNTYMKPNV